jgi:superfamily II DNA or RNA helicase
MTQYVLRQMQQEAVDRCTRFFLDSKPGKNGIAVCPTSWGKSLLISNVAQALPEPSLVFQPSKEILEQNLAKFHAYGIRPAVFSASMGRKAVGEITLATIGSVAGTKAGTKNSRASKAHLFQDFPNIFVDECDVVGAKSGQYKSFFDELEGVKILGVSVGPESVVEMFGGPYGQGFVGSIEQAFAVALSDGLTIRRHLGEYDIIDLQGVASRGWTGEGFDWKPCNSIIRHRADGLAMRSITAHGHRLTSTTDHCIYRAVAGLEKYPRSGRHKFYARLDCPPSSDLKVGDRLVGDNGAHWDRVPESVYDLVEIAAARLRSKVRVACDLSSFSVDTLAALATSRKPRDQAARWRKTNTLPLSAFRGMAAAAPLATGLLLEGSRARIERFVRLSEWAYVLGFYLGDGWITYEKKQIGRLGFAVEHALVPTVHRALTQLKGVRWNVRKPKPSKYQTGSVELHAANPFVIALLTAVCGRVPCSEKHVPGEWIISWPRAARLQLLQGMIDSDGSYGTTERNKSMRQFTSTSRALIDGLMSLLRSLGVSGSTYERKFKPGDGGVVYGRQICTRLPSYTVSWSGHAQDGDSKGKKGTPAKYIHDELSFTELPIRSTTNCEILPRYVYDLSMDGHPSFVASGILAHNTATPWRMSHDSFGSMAKFLTRTRPRIFHDIVHYTQVQEMVENGYWAKLEYHKMFSGFDRHSVKVNSTGTDYDERALFLFQQKIGFQDTVADVVQRLKKYGRRNCLVFVRFVKEAEYIASKVPGLVVVTSDTPPAERAAIGREFRAGRIWGIINCGVYLVGFDYPELDTIVLARLTKSLRIAYQSMGRGVRIHPDKESCYIVDMVGLTDEFGKLEDLKLYCEGESKWAMYGKPGGEDEIQLTNVYLSNSGETRCPKCGSSAGFWMRHCETKNSARIQKPPFGVAPNIRLVSIDGKTFYQVAKPGDPLDAPQPEYTLHHRVCRTGA